MRHLVSGRTMATVALSASIVVSLVATAAVTASSGSATRSSGPRRGTAAVARTDAAGTKWLCRPGLAHDPCTANLDSTAVPAHGPRTVTRAAPAANSAFDCFYVYPTVSKEQAVNADLKVQKAETNTAVMQASRFSALCNVWAPMYRQTTLRTLGQGVPLSAATTDTAYKSVLAGWKDYLAHYNRRSSNHFHRALARLLDADAVAEPSDRFESQAAAQNGVGDPPRRQRRGADGRRWRRNLPAYPRVSFDAATALRDRLFDVPEPAPGE